MTIGGIVVAAWIVLTLGYGSTGPVLVPPAQRPCVARLGSVCLNVNTVQPGVRVTW